MQVTFDQQYISVDYGNQCIAMVAWQALEQVSVAWFAGEPYWVLSADSARQVIKRSSTGMAELEAALVELHQFDAPLARQALTSTAQRLTQVWQKH